MTRTQIGRLVVFLAGAGALWANQAAGEGGHGPDIVSYLVQLVVILISAKVGGELFERIGQPAVLGELVIGMALGNMSLLGVQAFDVLKNNAALEAIAEVGVILLLFEVGLESHMKELMAVGTSALVVATVGVVAPMILGYVVSMIFLPSEAWYVHLFVGSTLAATSVGITARVLKDLRRMETVEARIILGAAVVDDVLGLVILAVVSGLVGSIATSGQAEVAMGPIMIIVFKAVAFLAGAIVIGRFIHIKAVRVGEHFRVPGIPLVIAICYCFLLSALSAYVGLAPIVGAFAAGLVLEESDYEAFRNRGSLSIEELVRPISTIFVPVFFVMMGLKVDLTQFGSSSVLLFATALSIAAVAGKQVCALGVVQKGVDRLAVGVGMIPRGEVGLIFTGIGASLMVGAHPVFGSSTVSALVVMVMVTTVMTPPLLKKVFNRKSA